MGSKLIDLGRPSPKQLDFLRARVKYVAFGGARGGGKSWAIRAKAVLLALRYPGIKILIVRRTYAELDNNHIQPLRRLLGGVAAYNDRDKRMTLPGGSTISFGYCATDGDLMRYQGAEYDIICIDEATQLTEHQLTTFLPCLRAVNGYPKRMYYTCNPGGPGHGYIKRLFVDRAFRAGEDPDEYVFVQSLPTDNLALMAAQPDYIEQLRLLPPKIRDAWLYGKWDVYEGQFFEEFRDDPERYLDRRDTHVIAPFEPPRGWKIYRSYDFGYARPFSCGWWAVDYGGTMYRIAELYGCRVDPQTREQIPNEGLRWTPEQQFTEIARIEREHPYLAGREISGVADPSIWDTSRGESVAETAAKHGIYFVPGDNARVQGWMQVHYRLQFDGNGIPRMYIFSSCKGAIRTLPLLTYSERQPEDLDTEGEDHIADEIRYMCMARPIRPVLPVPKKHVFEDPLDMLKEVPQGAYGRILMV